MKIHLRNCHVGGIIEKTPLLQRMGTNMHIHVTVLFKNDFSRYTSYLMDITHQDAREFEAYTFLSFPMNIILVCFDDI